MKRIACFILFAVFYFFVEKSYAQDISVYSDSLKHYFSLMAQERDDDNKEELNKKIVEYFQKALEQDDSFDYDFSSLKYVGDIRSEDDKLRIITWNLPYYDGTHQYFGFIQYKKNRWNTLTYKLTDKSAQIKNPEYDILSHTNWYGALYYTIIVHKYRGDNYYTLLGSDLNDLFSKKKLIEIVHFDSNDQPVFGAFMFKNKEKNIARVIFEYSAQANMGLMYDEKKGMIVYDHLSPFRPSLKGKYQFYGPDFSYDGLKFEDGIWNTYHDIDVRNYNIE
ncbi:MAG: hypothetical protein PWP52_1420 [Bacteroidales bacterium]|nr:hypothetical protein [Bacteroidales bacterium]